MSDELLTASATTLARMIRGREISARELASVHLDRIADVNPRINAVVQSDPEAVLRAAVAADDALAHGDELGPLHGVPFTAKDWLETSDYICAAGFEERRGLSRSVMQRSSRGCVRRARSCWARRT